VSVLKSGSEGSPRAFKGAGATGSRLKLAFALSLWFAMSARTWRGDADLAFILFGVRAVSASLLALLHLRWLGGAIAALEREGQLKS